MKDNLVGTPDTPNLVNVEIWGPKFGSVALGQCQVPDVMCQHLKNICTFFKKCNTLPAPLILSVQQSLVHFNPPVVPEKSEGDLWPKKFDD